MPSLIDDFLAAPIGVALLDRLEIAHRNRFLPFDALTDSEPAALEEATLAVPTLPVADLLRAALDASQFLAGPWSPSAPDSLADAYRLAGARRSLADAVLEQFGDDLDGLSRGPQEYWIARRRPETTVEPAFGDFSRVYGNGEFTTAGLWTTSKPPSEIHDDVLSAWELGGGPISRWHLPVQPEARVWTIDRPTDWVRLVEMFPAEASKEHSGWELPGANQHFRGVERLASTTGQHAVRTTVERHLLPDWAAVASEYDGVHLSWLGFFTSEGFVSDLAGGGVTMLRYWASERTLWLRDAFGLPEPLEAPALSGRINNMLGTDVRIDSARAATDRAVIQKRLNRQPD